MPKTARQYGLVKEEQLYVYDQSKLIALHNFFIQNYILSRVLPRLDLDPEKVNVVLTEDLRSILVRPVKEQPQNEPTQGQVGGNKVEPAQPVANA